MFLVLAGQFNHDKRDPSLASTLGTLRESIRPSGNRRGARSVQRILDAAAKLFGKEGFQGASMTSVARAAGVSKGLLHYHFQSKEHLLIEAVRSTFRQLHLRFDDRFQRGESGLDTALDALDALWTTVRELHALTPFMVETVSLATPKGPVRDDLMAFYAESMELLEQGIRKVFAEHEVAVPPERLAMLVRVCLHGIVVELALASDEAARDRVDQAYHDLKSLFAQVALTASPHEPRQEAP